MLGSCWYKWNLPRVVLKIYKVWISAGAMEMLTQIFCGFLHFNQANGEIFSPFIPLTSSPTNFFSSHFVTFLSFPLSLFLPSFFSFFPTFNGTQLYCNECLILFPGTKCFPECWNNWSQELEIYRFKWYVMCLHDSKWLQLELKTSVKVKQRTCQSSRQWQHQWKNIN
jgi:hypothetical protein